MCVPLFRCQAERAAGRGRPRAALHSGRHAENTNGRHAEDTKYEWDVTMRMQPGRILFSSRDVEGRLVVPVTLFELPLPRIVASGILTNNRNVLKIGVEFPNAKVIVSANSVFRFFYTTGIFSS